MQREEGEGTKNNWNKGTRVQGNKGNPSVFLPTAVISYFYLLLLQFLLSTDLRKGLSKTQQHLSNSLILKGNLLLNS